MTGEAGRGSTDGEPFRISTIGRHSLIYGIGMVLTKAVAIVMLPIYTRWLTPADYGILQLITMTFEVVTIFAGSRIAIGIFHFYHKEEAPRDRLVTVSTAYLLLGVTYALAAVATILAAPAIAGVVFGEGDLYATYIRIAAVSMAFEGLLMVPLALFQLQDRSKVFVLLSLARLTLQVTLTIIFIVGLEMGVLGVLWANAATHMVLGVALSAHLLRSVGARFRARVALGYLRFGVPLVVMQIATFVLTFGDRYFLNQAGDTSDVGLYALAYQFGFLVTTIGYGPFGRVWDPQRFAIARRADRDAIFAQVFVYLNVLLVTVALGIALFAGDALRIIATPDFHAAAAFVPVLAAAYVLQSWSFFLNLGIFITERTEYFTLANWVAALVALAGYLWLIPMWLAWGAAVTTLGSIGVLCALTHLFSQRLWRVEYEWGRVWRLVGSAVGAGAVAVASPPLPLLPSIGLHSALFALHALLVWSWILSSDERGAVLGRLQPYLRRTLGSA